MSQRLTTSFINTNIPGSYFEVGVKSNPSGLSSTGIISIVGEADGGPSFGQDDIKNNYFGPDQADVVAAKYRSGNIVDAMNALCSPSGDANIPGAPTRIYIVKTNTGLKAQSVVDTNYGTLFDSNYGLDGNKIKYQITASVLESVPTVQSDVIAALAASDPTPQIQLITFDKNGVTNTISSSEYLTLQAGNLGTKYYVWYKVDGAGTDPAPVGRTGILVNILSSDAWSAVATKTANAFNALSSVFSAVAGVDGSNNAIVTVTNVVNGEAEAISNTTTSPVDSTTVSVVQHGGLHDGSALNGLSFSIRLNGGAVNVVTLSNNEWEHDSVAELVNELNGLLPAGIAAAAGSAPNTIKLTMSVDSANYRKGYGKSFELIDSTPGDLSALSLDEGVYVSDTESEVETNIVRQDINANETLVASGAIGFELGYQGTTATVTITATTLSTTVTGGSGANLSIQLSQFQTLADLAAFINTKTGYSAAATTVGTQSPTSSLDQVTAVGIASTGPNLRPGRIKQALYRYKAAAATSSLTTFTAQAVAGLPDPMTGFAFLIGGEKGGTTGANVVDGLATLESVQTNFVVPLFSQDASEDIAEGLTASTSTYTIAAVNAATKNHVLKMSTAPMKRNRSGVCSEWADFATQKAASQSLANYRCDFAFQKVNQVNSQGNQVLFQPWYAACVAAGMQAAGFYKGITNKLANITSYVDPTGFDSGKPSDISTALDSGMLILQKNTAGNSWVADQTTYGYDTNFVYNSMQAVYLSDVAALNMADQLQQAFVGQSLADVNKAGVESFIQTVMVNYRNLKIIAPSDDAPLGWKNLKVSISGPVINVAIELKLATSVYFIPISISISQIEQAA